MNAAKILWVDDEMESLKSQIMFLENKGYEVKPLSNGFDAIDYVKENEVDVVLLDESMPASLGAKLSGTLVAILVASLSASLPAADAAASAASAAKP